MAKERASGIYMILCKTTGKRYIGSAVWIRKRWRYHREDLRKGKHHSLYLQRAWDKYGEGNFEFVVLAYCPSERLIELEQRMIDEYKAADRDYGYNMNPIAGSNLGRKFGPEFAAKISEARKGKYNGTDEMRQQLKERMKGNTYLLGHKNSEETKAKLRIARKGRTPALGMKMSEENKQAVSARFKGVPLRDEHKKKISNAHQGKKQTKEYRIKLAAVQSKFDLQQIDEIFTLRAEGLFYRQIADKMGCSKQTICNIIRGKNLYYGRLAKHGT